MTPRDVARFWSKVYRQDLQLCWPWLGAKLSNGGYGAFRLNGQTKRAHVIAYELHTQAKVPTGMVVMHLCNSTNCCNPYHLHLGTQAENMQHKALAGRAKGPRVNAKVQLSSEQLFVIQHSKHSLRELGRMFSVDHKTIARIKQAIGRQEPIKAFD